MPNLEFQVGGANIVPFAAAPTLAFDLRIVNTPPHERIHTAVISTQIRIDAARRAYSPDEQSRLRDLFGEPDRWGITVRSMLWTHASVVVPEFSDVSDVSLNVPASFDFTVAVTKYLDGLRDGVIPLAFLFSGSVFYASAGGGLQVSPISWSCEASYALPVKTWRALIDAYYPNTAWLTLRRDVFERLHAYKADHGIPTWESTVEGLLNIHTPLSLA
jgi:hypothetical protein